MESTKVEERYDCIMIVLFSVFSLNQDTFRHISFQALREGHGSFVSRKIERKVDRKEYIQASHMQLNMMVRSFLLADDYREVREP